MGESRSLNSSCCDYAHHPLWSCFLCIPLQWAMSYTKVFSKTSTNNYIYIRSYIVNWCTQSYLLWVLKNPVFSRISSICSSNNIVEAFIHERQHMTIHLPVKLSLLLSTHHWYNIHTIIKNKDSRRGQCYMATQGKHIMQERSMWNRHRDSNTCLCLCSHGSWEPQFLTYI